MNARRKSPSLDADLLAKFDELKRVIAELGSVAVALSGGVDSSLLLRVCHDVLGDRVVAFTARAEIFPEFELREAQQLAESLCVRQIVLDVNALEIEAIRTNPPDRCYHCKKHIFTRFREAARDLGIGNVADGANADDADDFRPGAQAARELNVRSPLKETGLSKAEIRQLSRHLGLPTWDKPSYACFASRFPYGQVITREALKKVAEAEAFLRGLGLRQCRVRHHGPVARIEAPPDEIPRLAEPQTRARITTRLKEIGYTYVALDLQGYRTGSMNEMLPAARRARNPRG